MKRNRNDESVCAGSFFIREECEVEKKEGEGYTEYIKTRRYKKMEVIKNYRNDKKLRDSFNQLAEAVFGLSFENWYQNGYWGDNYNPYSIIIDGKIVSNVSVNKTPMMVNGEKKMYIQLGTVMTYEEYRNRGYVRRIMEEVMKDYEDIVNGMYLFANDSVCEFYPKFGFSQGKEYIYSREIHNAQEMKMEKVIMDSREKWEDIERVMNANTLRGQMDMVENNELIMFYVTQFMSEDVYYHEETDTYVIAEVDGQEAFIHSVFSSTVEDLDVVFELLGADVKNISLGFTPLNPEKYQIKELKEDDTTFFVRGKDIEVFEEKKLRIPSLAHA